MFTLSLKNYTRKLYFKTKNESKFIGVGEDMALSDPP